MAMVKLQTSDKKIFKAPHELIECSETLTRMVINDREPRSADENVIELTLIHSATMEKIIEWATYHKDDSKLAKKDDDDDNDDERRCDDISSWDANFLDVDQKLLFDIILAANFLGIKGLLDVSCKTVAKMIKGKSPQEIRDQFNIENDLTPEEEAQIRCENEWCEDK